MIKSCTNCLKRRQLVCKGKKDVCDSWTPEDLDKFIQSVGCDD